MLKNDLQTFTVPGVAICCRHPERPAVVNCLMNRGFCSECVATVELRSAGCGYCPLKAECPVQKYYRDTSVK